MDAKKSPKASYPGKFYTCNLHYLYGIIGVMNTVTIPKKLAGKDDLVVVPRKEYEALLELKRMKEFSPTVAQKRALTRAELNFRRGRTLSYHELVKKLGFTS